MNFFRADPQPYEKQKDRQRFKALLEQELLSPMQEDSVVNFTSAQNAQQSFGLLDYDFC
jgi:hypothetical protein